MSTTWWMPTSWPCLTVFFYKVDSNYIRIIIAKRKNDFGLPKLISQFCNDIYWLSISSTGKYKGSFGELLFGCLLVWSRLWEMSSGSSSTSSLRSRFWYTSEHILLYVSNEGFIKGSALFLFFFVLKVSRFPVRTKTILL